MFISFETIKSKQGFRLYLIYTNFLKGYVFNPNSANICRL